MWCEMQVLRTSAPPGGAQLEESGSNSTNSMAPCVGRQQDGDTAAHPTNVVMISFDDKFLKTLSGAARLVQIVGDQFFDHYKCHSLPT